MRQHVSPKISSCMNRNIIRNLWKIHREGDECQHVVALFPHYICALPPQTLLDSWTPSGKSFSLVENREQHVTQVVMLWQC